MHYLSINSNQLYRKLVSGLSQVKVPSKHLDSIDSLRGLSVLAVCLFHFAGRDGFLPDDLIKQFARNSTGVIQFFVISGFVIPWSMVRGGYRLWDFPRFFLRRMVRLEPPYLVALCSVVVLSVVYAWVKGQPFPPTPGWWSQVLSHLGYTTRFFGFDWLDDVYWTLAIEFQFYLLIGLTFPLLSQAHSLTRWAATIVFVLIGLSAFVLPIKVTVLTYTPIFALGIVVFQYRSGLINWRMLWMTLVALTAFIWWMSTAKIALVAGATAAVIANVDRGWAPLTRLGAVSYSLYLFHATLGGAIINLGIKHTNTAAGRYLVLVAALTASVVVAIAVYWLVERPAQRLSALIRYRPKNKVAEPILDAPTTLY